MLGGEIDLAGPDVSSGLGARGALSAVAGPVVRVLTDERGGHASLGHNQRDELLEVRNHSGQQARGGLQGLPVMASCNALRMLSPCLVTVEM